LRPRRRQAHGPQHPHQDQGQQLQVQLEAVICSLLLLLLRSRFLNLVFQLGERSCDLILLARRSAGRVVFAQVHSPAGAHSVVFILCTDCSILLLGRNNDMHA
jgi:hypothetical protein